MAIFTNAVAVQNILVSFCCIFENIFYSNFFCLMVLAINFNFKHFSNKF